MIDEGSPLRSHDGRNSSKKLDVSDRLSSMSNQRGVRRSVLKNEGVYTQRNHGTIDAKSC